jgi:hypothetical protein
MGREMIPPFVPRRGRRAAISDSTVTISAMGRAMQATEWKTYRTRFLVKAKKLSSRLSFIDPLGRQHSGRKGDYLVEFSDGALRIAPRHFFEDVYVPMALGDEQKIIGLDEAARVRRKQAQSCPADASHMGLM